MDRRNEYPLPRRCTTARDYTQRTEMERKKYLSTSK